MKGNGNSTRESRGLSKRGLWPDWNPSQRELDALVRRTLDERDEQERRDSEQAPRPSKLPSPHPRLSLRSAAIIGALAGIPVWVRALALLIASGIAAAALVRALM